jgi:O-antigen/teichoic acid export membrane protein
MSEQNHTFSSAALNAVPWFVLSKLLLFIAYFVISIITVKYLGSEQYGVLVICKSISEILILVCTLGMTSSFTRFIPELALNKNKAGIMRLLSKAGLLQIAALAFAFVGLMASQNILEDYFKTAFDQALVFTFLLVVFEQFKFNINAVLTALFKAKWQAIFSTFNGILWMALILIFLSQNASVSSALAAPAFSYALVYVFAAMVLFRHLKNLKWKSPAQAIGNARVMKHSGSILLSTLFRMLMIKYTELFFLGGMYDAETVGMYDLAFSLPLLVIAFIPSAVQELFVSGFSEAYCKNPNCLPTLIRSFYKVLILFCVPVAIYGFMFADEILLDSYGWEFVGVSELISIFCLLHLLPLISAPLSMAIQAKEKVMNMFPTLVFQLSVNIILGYLLIVVFDQGVWGAMLAVFLTFVLTIPVRLWMVAKIIGGIYFPMRFFTRMLFVSLTSAYAIELCLTPKATWLILAMTPAYLVGIVFLCSLFPIFEASDESDLNQISQHKLQVIFTLFNKLRAKLIKRDTVLDMSYQETTSCQK